MKEFPPFRLDLDNECLWRRTDEGRDARVLLAPKAFALLRYLVEHAGRLVTQDELLDALWPETFVQPEVLKSQIFDVRSALGDHPKQPRFIETVHRRGYRFIAPVRDSARSPRGASAERRSRRLVGRESALSELRECLRSASRGERQLVFVTGEPGIGKTALVDELAREAAGDASLRVARGQCIEGYGGKEAFYPVLKALEYLFRDEGGEQVVEAIAAYAPTWLVQFPGRIRPEHRATLQRELLGATRERMLREIGEALEPISREHPLLLVFEDLQWVDPSTVDLLSALARSAQPARLMVVASYRPVEVALSAHPVKAVAQELLLHGLCREIAVDPLEQAEVAEYLVADTSGDAAAEGLAELVHRHSEGNPLFMIAVLDHLRRRGLISREDGGWQLLVPLEEIDLEVPDGLRQLIEAQIERLSTEEQRALEAASVSGVAFSASVGAAAAELEAEAFEEACERLARRHQIVRSVGAHHCPDGSVTQRYEFVHALYREVFYRRQAPGRRARLHLRVGEVIERLYSAQVSEMAAELAHHFEEGAEWGRAVRYLRAVADTAGLRLAPREAAAILEHALELVGRLPEAERGVAETEILERLVMMYMASNDLRFVETCEKLVERAERYGLVEVEVRALQNLAITLSWVSVERYREVVERARLLSERQHDPAVRAQSRAAYFVQRMAASGPRREELEELREIVAELRSMGDRQTLAPILLDYSFILWKCSFYREAYESAAESLATLVEGREENPFLSMAFQRYLAVVGSALSLLGEWGAALREITAGAAAAEKNGDQVAVGIYSLQKAYLYLYAMDFESALSICESAWRVRELMEVPTARRFCMIAAGVAEVAFGNFARAGEHLTKVRSEMESHPVLNDLYQRPPLEWGLTELWLGTGDLTRARLEAERFVEASLETEDRTWWALAWDASARVALAEEDPRRAEECIVEALEAMEGYEVPVAAWRVHATAAGLYALMGNTELAREHAAQSRATVLSLASSLREDEPLRSKFLSTPMVARIVAGA